VISVNGFQERRPGGTGPARQVFDAASRSRQSLAGNPEMMAAEQKVH
jgi:hypothetical protein